MASNKVSALKKKDDDSNIEESGTSTKPGQNQSLDLEDSPFDIE